jgi:hypothetical protein
MNAMNPWSIAAPIVGLLVAFILALFAGEIVKQVKLEPRAPEGIDDKKLRAAFLLGDEDDHSAGILGLLEAVIFFAAFYVEGAGIVGAGWLAFKVAAKWAAWQHVIKIPEAGFPTPDDEIENLRVKNEWGSRLLARFLLGTLYNVFCGLVGASLAKIMLSISVP